MKGVSVGCYREIKAYFLQEEEKMLKWKRFLKSGEFFEKKIELYKS